MKNRILLIIISLIMTNCSSSFGDQKIEESEKRIKKELIEIKTEFRGRISMLEKYKWIIIGAFIAVEFITVLMLSKKGFFPLFSFFN